jgi:hypothetical protein
VLGEYRGYGECRRMAIEGDRMYVASGDGGVMIMDITDRENPEVISQCWTRGMGEDVVKGGDYLYVADGDSGLTVVDIADENNPNVVTGLLTGYYQDLIDMYGNMLALGLSYTTASEISIVDAGNPLNPIKASGVMNGCFGFNMMFDSVYLHANASGGTVPRYKIIDLSNMYSPIEKDSVMQAFSGYDGIFVKDNKSYMYYEDSFYCYDVSDVNNISELGRRYRSGYTEIIRMSGDILFDYVYQGHMVNIWDYTVPTSPDSIASVQLRHYSYDIEPKDEYVYATLGNVTTDQIGKGIYGLSIYGFDMTPPSRITLIEPQDGDTAYNNEMNVTWHKSTDTGVGIDRYEVYVNGTERGETTDTSMTVNISDTGTRNVWVKVYDRVGNSSYSDTNAVYLLMGVEDKGKAMEIVKELTIRATLNKISIYNGTGEKQEVEVLDVMGRVVEKKELKQKEQYELSPKSGIYFIRSGSKKKTSKVAIIK